ncbi:MAG: FAD-dependent oxidoreductase, partial [Desulfotomaculaceae bacterium]
MDYSLEKVFTDVLIIGSGAAACMAALEAAKVGASVLVVDKGRLTRSGSTVTAGGGTAAAFGHTEFGKKGNPDTPEQHWCDTIKKGRYISNQDMVRYLVDNIPATVNYLVDLGVPYTKTKDGLYYQNKGVGQTYARNCTPRGNGAMLTEVLAKEFCYRGVTFLERTRIAKLLVRDKRVIGAIGINEAKNKTYIISAKTVVIAAGSATGLQGFASAAFKTEGDSYWLGYDAGAVLANMEFLEFTFIPLINGKALPCGGSTQIVSRGAKFYNQLGERFMERYNPDTLEQTTRAVLIDAFYKEMKSGRGPVFMECSSISPEAWREWSKIGHAFISFVKAAGIDFEQGRVELAPALHCMIGGILTDTSGRTSVDGLFAAGEAATGVQGAVRLGGNSIAECLVYGQKAGREAA